MMMPADPRLENLDQELLRISGERFERATNLTMLHLRDARLLLPDTRNNRILAKACIVFPT